MVMENKHLARLRADFADLLRSKKCYVLDIPDEYRYMDDDLIQELRSAIDPIIDAAIPLEREDPEALCP